MAGGGEVKLISDLIGLDQEKKEFCQTFCQWWKQIERQCQTDIKRDRKVEPESLVSVILPEVIILNYKLGVDI